MEKRILNVLFFIIILLTINLIQASSIKGVIYQVSETPDKNIRSPLVNATIRFYSINNETNEILTDSVGNFYFEPYQDIYKMDILYNQDIVLSADIYYNYSKNQSEDFSFNVYGIQNQNQIQSSIKSMSIMDNQCPNSNMYHGFWISIGITPLWEDYPKDFLKRPLLLVHGWGNDASENDNQAWGDLEKELNNKGHEIWRLQYYPANLDNRKNAGMIHDAISELLEKGYKNNFNQIDVVSYSMGSLAVRGYIQNMGESICGYSRSYNNDIRKYVIVAGPMFGTYTANNLNDNHNTNFGVVCGTAASWLNLNQISEATYDLEIGSDFTWNLNYQPINKNVQYLTIAGVNNGGFLGCSNNYETNDGIVALRSANLLKENIPLVILNKNHINIKNYQLSGKIISSFIKNDSIETIRSYLNNNNNEFYINPDSSSDMSHISNTGWIILSIKNNNLDSKNVALKKDYNFYNLTKNSRTNKWFYLEQAAAFSYRNYIPSGNYSIYLNQNETKKTLEINSGETTLYNLCLENWTLTKDWFSCEINDLQYKDWVDTESCNDNSTKPYPLNQSCNYCNYTVSFTNWTSWQNQGVCLINNTQILNRSKIEYDSNYNNCYGVTHLNSDLWNNGTNLTYWEFSSINCDYCNENISLPKYTSWSECSNGTKTRVKYYLDYNYAYCCVVTNLNSDCSIKNSTYQNITETSTDGCPNLINITESNLVLISPNEGIYNKRNLMFNISSKNKFVKLVYSDNNGRESTLCTNCYGYTRPKTLNDGNHTLLFKGILSNGNNLINQTRLLIDSKDPQISTTKPTNRKYTNGSDFYIKYTEENCQKLKILINGQEIFSSQCTSGKNIEKTIPLNINSFNGQEVEYKFIILDIANNSEESRPTKVKIDTAIPEIKDLKYPVVSRYAYFNMTILNEDKNSFNKVEYFDNSDSRPRWTSLCTSLKNNICYKKVYFKPGNHNIVIRASDDAGNTDFEGLNLTI